MSNINLETITDEPKLLGLPRHLVGAITGLIVFFLVTISLYKSGYSLLLNPLKILFTGLVFPGSAIWFVISVSSLPDLSLPTILLSLPVMAFGLSSLPAAFIGSFLISTQKSVRIIG